MKKSLIRNFNGLERIQIGKRYVRKDAIVTVSEETHGTIIARTSSGAEFTITGKDARDFLEEMGFNQE